MKRLALVFVLAAVALSAGCTMLGYQLGSMLPADIQTVFIPTCENRTTEPLIEQQTTRAIMAAVQMNGSLKIVREESAADASLVVILNEFWLSPVSYVKGDASTANGYRMNIRASYRLVRRSDNKVLAESPGLVGWSEFEMTGDMTTSKSVALRPAAEDLGRRIIDQIVESW
jgi:outer membrane lipopolysaccharide assembly protein LptE/RlpB